MTFTPITQDNLPSTLSITFDIYNIYSLLLLNVCVSKVEWAAKGWWVGGRADDDVFFSFFR